MRRGYAFILDVTFAALVLAVGLLILFTQLYYTPTITPPTVFGIDVIRNAYSTPIILLTNPDIISLVCSTPSCPDKPYGIANPYMTVGGQLGEYYKLWLEDHDENWLIAAGNLSNATFIPLIPSQYDYQLQIEDIILSMRNVTPFEDALIRLHVKTIVTGITRSRHFYGPYLINLTIWTH